jgi:hypothetical protein
VTFAFGDPAADVYGIARVARDGDGLVVLFADRRPVATAAGDGVATVDDESWTARFDDGERAFALTFDPAGPPAAFEDAGGLAGEERLCHVHGSVRIGGGTREIRGLGQRELVTGVPDWDRIDAARYVAAWLADGSAVVLRSVRPAGADYDGEASWAALLGPAGSLRVDEPRLTTTYDDEGRQRRAGLELWVGEDDAYPRRAAGEVLCGSTLDLGSLRLDCAFLRWRMDGVAGIGRYDILRRA